MEGDIQDGLKKIKEKEGVILEKEGTISQRDARIKELEREVQRLNDMLSANGE